jgi:hypothetical protein
VLFFQQINQDFKIDVNIDIVDILVLVHVLILVPVHLQQPGDFVNENHKTPSLDVLMIYIIPKKEV